jgi:hypothetical protein
VPAHEGHHGSFCKEETVCACNLPRLAGLSPEAFNLFRADDEIHTRFLGLRGDVALSEDDNPDFPAKAVGEKDRLVDTILRLRHVDILEIDGNIYTLGEFPLRRFFNSRFHGFKDSGPFNHQIPPIVLDRTDLLWLL